MLNLEGNSNILPVLLEAINVALASRRVLTLLLKHLLKPLEEQAIPLVVQSVHQGSIFHNGAQLTRCGKAAGTAGFVFYLVRSATLSDSNVIRGCPKG
jgi:hypothetical protein